MDSQPRAWAFALLGIDEYLRAFSGDRQVQAVGSALAERLLDLFRRTSRPEWPWFEDGLTYCNAQLPAALMVSGAWLARTDMIAVGVRALAWLASIQRSADGYFTPVGSNGFYNRGETPAIFDQQPVEAASMVAACADALRVDGDAQWSAHARRAFNWFLGENHLHASLYDPVTGGCRDGLHVDRVNENQGAESTLAFLLALQEMQAGERVAHHCRCSSGEPVMSTRQRWIKATRRSSHDTPATRSHCRGLAHRAYGSTGAVRLGGRRDPAACRRGCGLPHFAARSANGVDGWRTMQPTFGRIRALPLKWGSRIRASPTWKISDSTRSPTPRSAGEGPVSRSR